MWYHLTQDFYDVRTEGKASPLPFVLLLSDPCCTIG